MIPMRLIHNPRKGRYYRGISGAGDICGDAGTFYLDSNGNPQCAPTPAQVPTGATKVGAPTFTSVGTKMCGGQVVPDDVDCSPQQPPPPLACSSAQTPSTDPGVYVGNRSYISNLNLSAACDAVNRINAQIAQAGCTDFIGFDAAGFTAKFNSLTDPNGDWAAGVDPNAAGQALNYANFFTGSNPYATDPFVDPCGAHFAAQSDNPQPVASSSYYRNIPLASSPKPAASIQPTVQQIQAATTTGISPQASVTPTPQAPALPPASTTQTQTQQTAPPAGTDWLTETTSVGGFNIPNWGFLAAGLAALVIVPSLMGKRLW